MLKTLTAMNNLARTVLSLAVFAAIAAGGWFVYQTYFAERWEAQRALKVKEARIAGLSKDLKAKQLQIDRLTVDLEAKQREIERLDMALRLLKVDHRVAQIDVLGQQGSADTGDLVTHFSFVELDREENPLDKPRVFRVKGDLIYVDSLVVKFTDEYVETDDPLRSTSLCLFRRVFGETQKPSEGFVLDPVGSQPAAYRNGGKISDWEQEIWAQFWEYANNPVKARQAGVRAAHGEAPFQKLVPGKRYKVLLRASDGLSFGLPEALPPDAKGAPMAETL